MKEAFEKIREKLEGLKSDLTDWAEDMAFKLGIEKAQKIVSEVEAEYGNGWIPCSERLPEKDGYYLTCDHKGNIHVFYHHPMYVAQRDAAFGICENHPQFYKPIAWRELPELYKPEKGE